MCHVISVNVIWMTKMKVTMPKTGTSIYLDEPMRWHEYSSSRECIPKRKAVYLDTPEIRFLNHRTFSITKANARCYD